MQNFDELAGWYLGLRFGTTSNRDWCSSHYENDKCYRFKLDKQ